MDGEFPTDRLSSNIETRYKWHRIEVYSTVRLKIMRVLLNIGTFASLI